MKKIKIISLGAGVQSSTMFLMSCIGVLPKVDAAIFSDTQGEPPDVYEHLQYLTEIGKKHSIPVYKVTKGDLLQDYLDFIEGKRKRSTTIPFWTKDKNGNSTGLLPRQCTVDYKIMPTRKKSKEIMESKDAKEIEMWIGISTDEIQRINESRVKYITHKYPLIDDLRFDRNQCIQWYNQNEFRKPPRSACYYCPFHSNSEWMRIKNKFFDLWEKSIEIDKQIRNIPGMNNTAYLHRDRKPIDTVELDLYKDQIDLFNNECLGMCGV